MRQACSLLLVLGFAVVSPVAAGAVTTSPSVLPFIDDDYGRALAEARARKVPLVVEVWAPWCHTCRSMKAYVFTDRALASQARRFVWLALDTEKPGNAPFRKQLSIAALPSIFVLDPADERVALRWIGGATVPQLTRLLDDGRAAVAMGGTASGKDVPETPADAALVPADAAYGRADYAAAATAYRDALARAPANWPRYGRVVESLLFALQQTDANEQGAQLALDAYPRVPRSPSAANIAASGLDCALQLPADHPRRAEYVSALERIARAVAQDRGIPMAADDRSGVYISIHDARDDAHDSTGMRANDEAWAAFLEGEAARAATPDARAVFDAHRLSAYLELRQPERAVPMLIASERDLPDDYNPPQRLATAYKAMKRWNDALAASDRAMAKAYGPRKLLLYQTRSDIYLGRGDPAAARRTLSEAVAFAEALPPGQRSESTIASLRKKADAIPEPGTAATGTPAAPAH
jgi:thioredoxin-like negative regulator of GroEL